jgi:hypothetical protein
MHSIGAAPPDRGATTPPPDWWRTLPELTSRWDNLFAVGELLQQNKQDIAISISRGRNLKHEALAE